MRRSNARGRLTVVPPIAPFLRLLLLLFSLAVLPATAVAEAVDLELVLCVDASGSVSDDEYDLQLTGLAAAFRDSAVQSAITSGPRGRVAVALVVWADASTPKDKSDWHVLDGAAAAERFARVIERFPRRVEGGTGIGSAVAFSVSYIEMNDIQSSRKVVDVSGDGIETPVRAEISMLLPAARNMAAARDVVLNGLAITNEVHNLDDYYRDNLMLGPDSFVMTAPNYAAFKIAIREKLLREIAARVALLGP